MLTEEILCYGRSHPPPVQIALRAGTLAMIFEPAGAFLRYLRLDEQEVIRGIYCAVRDHNWDTIEPKVSDLRVESTLDAFQLSFKATHQERDVHFVWNGSVQGEADGTIRFAMDGEALADFRRNRIGFCVLHSMACAGQPCELEHTDGSRQASEFPKYIAPQHYVEGRPRPHQPFADLRAMSHEVKGGLKAKVRFEGDIFELEDQRNWTDASFKTYCTPLEFPFPVDVPAGTQVRQAVTLTLEGRQPAARRRAVAEPVRLGCEAARRSPLPPLGLGLASHGEPLTDDELARLKALDLSHLRVDLRLFQGNFPQELTKAADQAEALGAALEVAIHLGDPEKELPALAQAVAPRRPDVVRWLVFHKNEKSTSGRWLELAREQLASAGYGTGVFAGANAYFAEINRARPPIGTLDGVCYSINPQVHAFDDASLVESLAAQGATVQSAQAFAAGRPVAVTPVTLKPRFNPNATGPEPEPPPGELPPQVDVRQLSLFGAGWTLGSIKYLSESGASSVTYYETTGWRGVMERPAGSPLPDQFPSLPGAVFPMYHVFAAAAEFRGGQVLASRSSDPLAVEIFALAKDGRMRIMIANLKPNFAPVRIELPEPARLVRVATLSADNAEAAMREPERFRQEPGRLVETTGELLELSLAPYGLAQVDITEERHG